MNHSSRVRLVVAVGLIKPRFRSLLLLLKLIRISSFHTPKNQLFRFSKKSKFTQLEMTKGVYRVLVLNPYLDFLENSLSCGTFGLISVGTNFMADIFLTTVALTTLALFWFMRRSVGSSCVLVRAAGAES